MKKVTLWSIVVILALLLYIVLVLLFRTLFQDITERRQVARTPAPTFTLPPAPPAVVLATSTPDAPTPSPTSSPTSTPAATPTEAPTEAPTLTPPPAQPQAVASITVNVRSGPGVNYPVVATLPPNVPVVIVGQNAAGTWWQIEGPDGSRGWVAASVVQASANVDVPIAQAPAPPAPPAQPSPTPAPPAPEPQPAHQYEPTGWFDDTNYGLTRFLGTITDADGNPVNGVFVEAQCGDYRVISNRLARLAGVPSMRATTGRPASTISRSIPSRLLATGSSAWSKPRTKKPSRPGCQRSSRSRRPSINRLLRPIGGRTGSLV